MGFLVLTQTLNGLQLGLMLFLIAAGLTLVLGIMDFVNLAHGSLYMLGAYLTATLVGLGWPFVAAVLGGVVAALALGALLEHVLVRRLYARNHLDHVLATFGLVLACNEAIRMIWGPIGLSLDPPAFLDGSVDLAGFSYASYRLAVIGLIALVGLALWWLITRTRLGMLVRAGSTHAETVSALGINIGLLKTFLFALGAALAALGGALIGPLRSVQPGMGEEVLIQALVVIIVGGIGSLRGAFCAALGIGLIDTLGRAFLPLLLGLVASMDVAQAIGPALASMLSYLVMALVLAFKPEGLMPAVSR